MTPEERARVAVGAFTYGIGVDDSVVHALETALESIRGHVAFQIREAVADERAACARLAEEAKSGVNLAAAFACDEIAAAIRARSS